MKETWCRLNQKRLEYHLTQTSLRKMRAVDIYFILYSVCDLKQIISMFMHGFITVQKKSSMFFSFLVLWQTSLNFVCWKQGYSGNKN